MMSNPDAHTPSGRRGRLMTWFLRGAFRFGRLRLNLSKRDVGISAGVKGARVGVDATGKPYSAGGRCGPYFGERLGTGPHHAPAPTRAGRWGLVALLGGILIGVAVAHAGEETRVDLYDAKGNRTGYAVVDRENGRLDVSGWATISLTAALVLVTAYYAWQNKRMVEQMQRQSEAIERQANATVQSTTALRATIKEQHEVGHTIVASAIQSGLRTIELWKARKIQNLAYLGALPDGLRLVPETGRRAVEYARVLSPEAAVELASALDSLEAAETGLQIALRLQKRPPQEIDQQCSQVLSFLELANQSLNRALELLRTSRSQEVH